MESLGTALFNVGLLHCEDVSPNARLGDVGVVVAQDDSLSGLVELQRAVDPCSHSSTQGGVTVLVAVGEVNDDVTGQEVLQRERRLTMTMWARVSFLYARREQQGCMRHA
jgi:hypothetical protein